MNSDRADFFDEVRTVLVTATKTAHHSVTSFAGTVLTTKRRRPGLTGHPVLTSVERVAWLAASNLHGILADYA